MPEEYRTIEFKDSGIRLYIASLSLELPISFAKVTGKWAEENYFNIRSAIRHAYGNTSVTSQVTKNTAACSRSAAMLVLIDKLAEYYASEDADLKGEKLGFSYWKKEGLSVFGKCVAAEMRRLSAEPPKK